MMPPATPAPLNDYAVGPVFVRRVALILITASIALFIFSEMTDTVWASDEDGPIELLHNIVLAISVFGFAAVAVRARGAARMYMTGMAILCLLVFLREWEIVPTGPVTAYLDSKPFRWHSGFATLAIAGAYAAARPSYVPEVLRYLRSYRVWPYLAALALLIVAQGGEKMAEIADLGFFRSLEEIFEFDGYGVLLALAIAFYAIARAGARRREPA